MKNLHSLKDIDSKKALVRVDFNVPLSDSGKILDNSRITAALPTIEYLLSRNCKIILMSHLGKPKGRDEKFSLAPVADELSRLLKRPVKMEGEIGDIVLLENLRFNEAEENPEKNPSFAKKLASLGDFYVNDAFGCAHRAHASIVDVAREFPQKAYPGFLMEKELSFLGKTLKSPKRPFLVLLGGAKISSKIGVIQSLLEKADQCAIGGGMAFTFIKASGIPVGNSLIEESYLEEAKKIFNKVLLPVDVVIAQSIDSKEVRVIDVKEGIPDGWMGLDIGPKTVESFTKAIGNAKTIFWNGPMGVFENLLFAEGTKAIAKAFAGSNAVTIAGGGETAVALIPYKNQISHLSTGGGASLEFIEFGTLPGIEVLT